MISVGIASVNAAEIDDGFESVTKNAQSSDSSFPSAYSAIGYSLVDENGLPSNFSSKNLGFVTPIKAQQYNDCWAVAMPTEIIHTAETTAVNFLTNFLFIKSPVYNVKLCVCFRIIICLFFFIIKNLNLSSFRFAL